MASQTRTARLVDEFVASYPSSLPERLEWLSNNLLIDRPRFLRLMGLSPEEVERELDTPWEELARRWEAGARWIEDLLCQLITMFSYDWKTLGTRLHQLASNGAADGSSRPAEYVGRLHTLPPVERERTLAALISAGGQDIMSWLIEYLTLPVADKLPSKNHQ